MNLYRIILPNGTTHDVKGKSIEDFNNIYFEIWGEDKELVAIVPIDALIITLKERNKK